MRKTFPSLSLQNCLADTFTEVLADCCPTNHAGICCEAVTSPCNDTLETTGPLTEPSRAAVIAGYKPYCMQPWNSSACEAGFYYDPVTQSGKACPNGESPGRVFVVSVNFEPIFLGGLQPRPQGHPRARQMTLVQAAKCGLALVHTLQKEVH